MTNRVLVVEDDATPRETLRLLLELEGYEVTTASDGLDGLARFREQHARIVLLDLMMPRLDGFGFAAELERSGWRDETSLLILTADGRAEAKAARIGADAWLEKPFDVGRLLQAVAELAGGKRP